MFFFFSAKDSPQTSEVGEAVKRLREAIQEGGNRGPHAQVCKPTYNLDFQILTAKVSIHACTGLQIENFQNEHCCVLGPRSRESGLPGQLVAEQ